MPLTSNSRVSGKLLAQMRARDEAERAKAERKAAREAKRAAVAAGRDGMAIDQFLSFIDTSGGSQTCHLWKGSTSWNHENPDVVRYERGHCHVLGHRTNFAHRIICEHEFKLDDIDPAIDISPTCGNHLCCNLEHLVARPHGGVAGSAHVEAVAVAVFFGREKAKEDTRTALEADADRILGAAA